VVPVDWPSFELGGRGLALALVRGSFVAALLSSFGASLFLALIAPRALQSMHAREPAGLEARCLRLVRGSLVAAILALPAWLVLEASAIAEAANARQALAAIPTVLFSTSFGRVLIAKALTLLAAILAVRVQQSPQWRLATVGFAGLATVLEAGHSHAFAIEDGPSLLLFSQSVHLLAAGAWLGGLAPLLIVVRGAMPRVAVETLRRFSDLAALSVAAIAATAGWQGWRLAGGMAGLTRTAYGWALLLKLTLFAMLALAAVNRFRLTLALSRRGAQPGRRALIWTIAVETALGLLVVLATGVLSSLEPGMHAQG
jgi:putative copper export protein